MLTKEKEISNACLQGIVTSITSPRAVVLNFVSAHHSVWTIQRFYGTNCAICLAEGARAMLFKPVRATICCKISLFTVSMHFQAYSRYLTHFIVITYDGHQSRNRENLVKSTYATCLRTQPVYVHNQRCRRPAQLFDLANKVVDDINLLC